MCKKTAGESVQELLDGVFNKICEGAVDRIVKQIVDQLAKMCPTTPPSSTENSSLSPDEELELSLPECCKNMFRAGGRQLKRGMLDVEQGKVT